MASRFRRTAAMMTVLVLGFGGLGTGTGYARPDPGGTPPAEAPDATNALAAARRFGVPVEVADRRTESSRVFANPSGTWTLEQYVLPVRTQRDGRWVPIDTSLARGPDGVVAPKAIPLDLRFSGGGTGPLVTMTQGAGRLSLSWPTALPEPRLAGDSATYPDVLPGVDLVLRADSTGYSQTLVVHDAVAAANPALRRIRFGTATRGLTIRGDTVVDEHGTPVFTSGPPMMWDSTPDAPRRRPMRLEVGTGELAVLPDPSLLSDARFPLYIDPSYSVVQHLWTIVNLNAPNTPYGYTGTAHPRDIMRVGETYGSDADRWRAFVNVPIYQLARSTITRAWFAITLDHSAGCGPTPVSLFHTTPLNPAVGVTWNNTADDWLGAALATENGSANEALCPKPDQLMEFESTALKTVVQNAVTVPQGTLGFGLRIPSPESDQNAFKKFFPNTARLNVEYNTAPLAPSAVSTVPPTPCGTATAPTALGTATPQFSGVGYDPNADNVASQLQFLEGEIEVSAMMAGTAGSGSAFAWPAVAVGVLPTDAPARVFSYRARTRDSAGLFGPYSARCYFTVATVRPQPPGITSTDYPAGALGKAVGETGTVTFAKAAADTDIAGFRYGFSSEQTTMWVASTSSVAVPITLWPDTPGDPFDVERTLYVRAVDQAGNASPPQQWALRARGRAVTTPPVHGDTNGDRRADLAIAFDQGSARTAIWNLIARPGGFHPGYIGWDSGINGGFPVHRTANVRGDFNGDGRTDMAQFREDPDKAIRLFLSTSDGSRYQSASEPVATLTGFRVSHLKVVAGDFDHDGDDDIAMLQGLAGNQTKLWTMTSFAAPVLRWDSGAGNLLLDDVNPVAGDLDGDGDDDVAYLRAYPGSQTQLWVASSNGGTFAAPVMRWDSGAGAFAADRAKLAAGNVDGDTAGTDEIVALYDDGDTSARLFTLRATGSLATWWDSGAAGSFDARRAVLAAGDYDGDGRADVATFTDIGGGVRRLATRTSTGTAFAAAVTAWDGYIGDAAPTVQVDPTRRYRLIARHSDKCAEIPGAQTTKGILLDQWTCVATATHETFAVERLGASPYFHLKTFNGMCLDVDGWKFEDNVRVWQWVCGNGGPTQPNQQFRLDYVVSTPLGPVVRIVVVHTNKCLTVGGAGVANGVTIVQSACAAGPPAHQQFYLRPEP